MWYTCRIFKTRHLYFYIGYTGTLLTHREILFQKGLLFYLDLTYSLIMLHV